MRSRYLNVRYGRTERRTDRRLAVAIAPICVASRGKNNCLLLPRDATQRQAVDCGQMRHFKWKSSKIFRGVGHPSPHPTPLAPRSNPLWNAVLVDYDSYSGRVKLGRSPAPPTMNWICSTTCSRSSITSKRGSGDLLHSELMANG